jgi:hypothetical protein
MDGVETSEQKFPTGSELQKLVDDEIMKDKCMTEKERIERQQKEEELFLSFVDTVKSVVKNLPQFIKENSHKEKSVTFDFDLRLEKDITVDICNRRKNFQTRVNFAHYFDKIIIIHDRDRWIVNW